MDVELIYQITAIGIIVAVVSSLLHNAKRDDMAMMVSIVGIIIVLIMVVKEIRILFDTIKSIFRV